MTFTEDWYPPRDADALAIVARSIRHVPGDIAEFGSWEGRSALILEAAVAPRFVTCVDPWSGQGGEQYAAAERAYQTFLMNVCGRRILRERARWQDYLQLAHLYDKRFALIHIDAEHTYEATRDAILGSLPLISPGGVICGHDYDPRPAMVGGWPGVVRAVDETLPTRDVLGTVWWQRRERM